MDDTTEASQHATVSGREHIEPFTEFIEDRAAQTPPPDPAPIDVPSSVTAPAGLPIAPIDAAFAGLQAGMIGVLCMLAWLGIDASLDRRGFWRDENLFSTLFYGSDAIRPGFTVKTIPGVALYLALYCLLGLAFAYLVRDRLRPFRRLLFACIFSLGWFYLSFHFLWKSAMPLVYLLYADRPMVVGHLIFGACLAGFPGFFPGPPSSAASTPPSTLTPDSAAFASTSPQSEPSNPGEHGAEIPSPPPTSQALISPDSESEAPPLPAPKSAAIMEHSQTQPPSVTPNDLHADGAVPPVQPIPPRAE